MSFPANEIVEVTVGGGIYRDWETVLVHYEVGTALGDAELTVAEFDPMPARGNWWVYRIKPGDAITITLGGTLAFTGWVNLRQAAYDANAHGVEIKARSLTQKVIDSSVVHDTMQFKDQSFSAIAQAVMPPGVPFQMRGQDQKFEDAQVHYGESVFNFLDRLGRPLGLFLNTDVSGSLIASDGKSGGGGGAMLVEGRNILRATCIIRNDVLAEQYIASSQNQGTDEHWGAEVTQMQHVIPGISGDASRQGVSMLLPVERAMNNQLLQGRGNFEADWRNGATIEAEIVVYGWHKPGGGGLWQIEEMVSVDSPMLMLNGDSLWVRAVTFTQDNENGSTTTLSLTNQLTGSQYLPSGQGGAQGP